MWKSIIAIKLESYWKFTPDIEGVFFRLRHINPPLNPIGYIGQAELVPNTDSCQIFQIRRLNGLTPYEIIEYVKPTVFENRRLIFRQETKAINNWIIEVEVSSIMPVVDLTPDQPPVNPTIATTKIPTSVSIAGNSTATVKLLPASATNNRKHATFFNPSTKRNLYVDTDSNISVASAVAKVAPGKVYVSDFPNWQGEYWGMLDASDTVPTAIAIEEYV